MATCWRKSVWAHGEINVAHATARLAPFDNVRSELHADVGIVYLSCKQRCLAEA